jgi:hypothetical protein
MKDGSGVTKTPHKLEADTSSAHISWAAHGPEAPGSLSVPRRHTKKINARLESGFYPQSFVCLFICLIQSGYSR